VDVAPLGLTRAEARRAARCRRRALSSTVHPTVLRAVTHLDVSDEDVDAPSS